MYKFILILICSLIFGTKSHCSQPSIGLVEVRAAILLHPTMKDYHFSLSRFRRQFSQNEPLSPSEWEQQMRLKFDELHATLQRLNFEQKTGRKSLDPKLMEIAATASPERVLSEQVKVVEEYDRGFVSRRREAVSMIRDWFLDEAETLAVFQGIVAEIMDTAHDIGAVLDLPLVMKTNILGSDSLPPVEEHRLNNQNFSAFTLPVHVWNQNGAHPYGIYDYFHNNHLKAQLLSDRLLPSPVLKGAVDLTPLIIARIWQSVPSEIDLPQTMVYLYESLISMKLGDRHTALLPEVQP